MIENRKRVTHNGMGWKDKGWSGTNHLFLRFECFISLTRDGKNDA